MATFGERLKKQRKSMGLNQKALGSAVGVGQSTIAHYESNDRFPSEKVLKALADTLSISLDELLGREPVAETIFPEGHQPSESEAVESLTSYLIGHDEENATELVLRLRQLGWTLTHLLEGVIRPAMVAIGSLWEKGVVSEATEHYATAVTRRLLTRLSMNLSENTNGGTVLLMTPAVEKHTLPLEMMRLLFEEAGWRVLYIGTAVPIEGLRALIAKEGVTHVALSVSIDEHLNALDHLLDALSNLPVQVMLGGRAFVEDEVERFSSVERKVYRSLAELEKDLKTDGK